MIKESIRQGEVYAVLHGSIHDRSRARRFHVLDVNTPGGDVTGLYLDALGLPDGDVVDVSVRLIRNTWERWEAGEDRPPAADDSRRQRKNLPNWLRYIASDPDASEALKAAALQQLESLAEAS